MIPGALCPHVKSRLIPSGGFFQCPGELSGVGERQIPARLHAGQAQPGRLVADEDGSSGQEGFEEIADWFETLAKAEKSHAGRFAKAAQTLG